jgi:Domain of unknown function (DUF4381)
VNDRTRSRRAARTAAAVGTAWVAAFAVAGACRAVLAAEPADPAPSSNTPTITPTALPPFVPPAPRPPASAGPAPAPAPAPAEAAEDIRDIRGPKFLVPPWLLPAVIAGAVLLAFGAWGLWRWLRRRPQPRVLLPFEVALQRLEEMRALMQPDAAREFSIAVSDVVRRYIEERFGVTATHRTTEEFLHDLLESSHAPLARHRALLSEFLQACDLVKFAGMSLTLQNMESLHHSARAFVLETAKPDEPIASDAPPAPETAHA